MVRSELDCVGGIILPGVGLNVVLLGNGKKYQGMWLSGAFISPLAFGTFILLHNSQLTLSPSVCTIPLSFLLFEQTGL